MEQMDPLFDKLRAFSRQVAATESGALDHEVQQQLARITFAIEVVDAIGDPAGDAAVDVLRQEWARLRGAR